MEMPPSPDSASGPSPEPAAQPTSVPKTPSAAPPSSASGAAASAPTSSPSPLQDLAPSALKQAAGGTAPAAGSSPSAPPSSGGLSGWKRALALAGGGLGATAIIAAGVVLATRHPGAPVAKQPASQASVTSVAAGFSPVSLPGAASTGVFTSATCPGATTCYVVGGGASGLIASTADGRAWIATAVPQARQLTAVACVSPARCWAGGETPDGSALIVATTDGRTWRTQIVTPDTVISSIACPAPAACIAVGTNFRRPGLSDVFATTNGGVTWGRRPLPARDAQPFAVSCWDTTRCMAAGGGGPWTTADLGATWQGHSTPGPSANTGGAGYLLDSVTYVSADDVWTVGGTQCGGAGVTQCDGWAFHSTDGGVTWTPYAQADRKFPFAQQVVCGGAHCLVLAQAFSSSSIEATDDGSSWRSAETLKALLDTLACSSRDFCVAAGSAGLSPALYRTGG